MKRITIEIVCNDKIAIEVDRVFRPILIDADVYVYKIEKIEGEK